MRSALCVCVCVLLIAACGAPDSFQELTTSPRPMEPITGAITKVTTTKQGALALRVEGTPRASGDYIYVISVAEGTPIYREVSGHFEKISRNDLILGTRILVTLYGPVAETGPPQTSAEEIIVLP